MEDYHVVVGIDFGITYSGFAYAHKRIKNIIVHSEWQEYCIRSKIPTVLLYDNEYKKVKSWGFKALEEEGVDKKPVKLFKSHLGMISKKIPLPNDLDYKRAITDYLHEIGKVMKQTIKEKLGSIGFYNQALIVLTVPADFDYDDITIMRECVFKAGLLKSKHSQNLKFITEPEAVAIHCMEFLKDKLSINKTLMVIECGDYTVNSTTIQLLAGEKLSVMTERTSDECGDDFVGQEFLKFLQDKVGVSTINRFREKHSGQLKLKNIVQEFCKKIKIEFTGVLSKFQPISLDLDELCPTLKQYCEGEYFHNMEEIEWCLKLNFEDIKAMFDPIIEKIIQLIKRSSNDCDVLLFVGIFIESKYLQLRIEQEFGEKVFIPPRPVTAIMEGAVQYGLKWTYDLERSNGIGAFESFAPYTNNMRAHIQNLENTIQEYDDLINGNNKEINRYQMITQKLENDIKEIKEQHAGDFQQLEQDYQSKIELQEERIDQLQPVLERNTNLEEQLEKLAQENASLKEEVANFRNVHEKDKIIQSDADKLNEYKSLYDNLRESHESLISKNNQNQMMVQKLEKDIEDTKERHKRDVLQLEKQINIINQQYQSKIDLQEQKTKQSLELKENQIVQKLGNDIEGLKNELKYQLRLQQSKLKENQEPRFKIVSK